ncbi:hypothetical protein BGZ65_004898 [Modicella reniformis]|uniref:Uncharacterized protein n=1 Tax=Modicella reniformis TaxID=1440133 RepID=A0A9P6MHE3_9FUNG|nr:hypothetical protein BGZ65_004898 [Modicella reniformis]
MNMTPEEIKAMMAVAKAKAHATAQALRAQQQHQQPPAGASTTAGTVATGTGAAGAAGTTELSAELVRQRAEAVRARFQSLTASKSATSTVPVTASSTPVPVPAAPAAPAAPTVDPRARGGLGVDLSSMISRDEHGNLVINAVTSGNTVRAPSFATAKINQKQEPKKELKILDIPDDFTNPEKNPYYDPNLSVAPKERKARPLRFAPKGKFKSIANQLRAEQRIEQLRKEIEQGGQANVQEEDLQVKDGFTKRDVLKDGVEWWDAAFLPNKTYEDLNNGQAKIETEDSLITHYIQHPVAIEPPNEAAHAASSKPRPLMLTTKERKKLRRQRRRELLKEKQDKIRLGLLPPDAPKVKLANMMRVMGQEAVLNPTEVEMKVRQQMAERLQGHLEMNAERKLTLEERKAKELKKKDEDVAKGIHKKFKVDKNAQQLGLTGVVLMYPTSTMVVVEGGLKSINQYKKLMLRRIDWTDNTRLDGTEATSESTIDNKCLLVWEGQLRERQFKKFQFIKSRTDAQLKETLARFGIQHYWDQALSFKEEDMLGAQVTL